MPLNTSALAATLRALHGESDVHVIAPALDDIWCARVLAFAPNVDPLIGALGALAGKLPNVLSPAMRDSPALSAAIASLIGTDTGKRVLPWWAEIAPTGWGASHAAVLIDAVHADRGQPWAAAALIGPTNDAAALLTKAGDITRTVRRWGQTTPDNPTAWMDHVTPAERDRLLDAFRTYPNAAVDCLPWLPGVCAADIVGCITNLHLRFALAAYAEASPVARTRHADVLAVLIQRAKRDHFDELARLAAVSRMEMAWTAVAQLLRTNPRNAIHVVEAAPWDDVHADVQTLMLSAVDDDPSGICAAIAFARGVRSDPPPITREIAHAFFAAVTPAIWNALPEAMQCMWNSNPGIWHAHLAVRSLGPDPTFLAYVHLDNALISVVRHHTRDADAERQTLLPITVRDPPLVAVSSVVATLPSMNDPIAFMQIVGRRLDMPPAFHAWIAAHPTTQAAAATALRVAARLRDDVIAARLRGDDVVARCAALAAAFTGWSSEEATALLAVLPGDVVAALRPNTDALTNALAHPDRRDSFRQVLEALDALPPATMLPILHALDALAQETKAFSQRQAGEGLARTLRDDGGCFLALVDTLADAHQMAVLPARDDRTRARLRALAVADPLVAHYLAYALEGSGAAAALDALAAAPFDALLHIWSLLPENLRRSVLGDEDVLLTNVAAPERADDLAQALQAWDANAPHPLLALRLLIDADEERRARGVAALAKHPDLAASLLPLLRDDLRTMLTSNLVIAFASADLPPPRYTRLPPTRDGNARAMGKPPMTSGGVR